MKKIMSVITSAVMTLCIVSVFLTSAVPFTCSADDSFVLTPGNMGNVSFDGISIEINGDSIKFITEYPEIIAEAKTEVSVSCTDYGYLFKPMQDGKYIISLIRYLVVEPPTDSLWFPPVESFTYEFVITNGNVTVDAMHRFCDGAGENSDALIESFYTAGTSSEVSTRYGTVFGAYYLVLCLADNNGALFVYNSFEDSDSKKMSKDVMIMSDDINAEAYVVYGEKVTERNGRRFSEDGRDFPTIGEASLPAVFYTMHPPTSDETPKPDTVKLILNEGSRSTVYSMEYSDDEPLLSTLMQTECPENDINADGSFNVADVVLLQSFLLGKEDALILNWRAADLCNDGRLDIFDLVLMKKALISAAS